MEDSHDLSSIQEKIQAALVAVTKTTGYIAAEDLGFQRQLDRLLGTALDEQASRVLALSNALLKSATSIADLRAPFLKDVDEVDSDWRGIVDVIDSLLEKTDTCLDEYTGVRKRKVDTFSASEQSKTKGAKIYASLGSSFRNQNIVKPQLSFEVKADNSNILPWKPLLTSKPHAVLPLEDSLGSITNDYGQQQYDYSDFIPLALIFYGSLPAAMLASVLPECLSKSQRLRIKKAQEQYEVDGRYKHPYETEILQLKYPGIVCQKADPIHYLPIDSTSAIFVDTFEGVLEMLEELKRASEIAVDLEHHDTRSYVGLTSLMQISTRSKDWIVDTLKPWRQNLQVLNKVFADPKIIKVFHGAYMDIVWLQRDLGLYIVGLFDTYYASRTLGYQGGSLAFLLKKFIDFDADKKYQMADWRIRPLPKEMLYYARSDTHYLLYIYDNMRNELIDRTNPDVPDEDRLGIVLHKSKETSLFRYEKQVYNAETGKGPGGWYTLLSKPGPGFLNNEQFSVFRAVHEWRDKIARIDDDSTDFVMRKDVVFTLAKLMPKDMIALMALLHPISYNVKSRTGELLEIIQDAIVRGEDGPSMMEVFYPQQADAAAKVAAAPAPKTLLSAVVDEGDLVTNQSSFWGGAFGSSIWETPSADTNETLRLAVPLPQLSSEIFATSELPALADQSRKASPSPEPTGHVLPEQAFVIKRGSKRRSEDVSDDGGDANTTGDLDMSLNDIEKLPLDSEDSDRKNSKATKRVEKKERKRLKAEVKAKIAAEPEDDKEEEAFDYSKAESVLSGKKVDRGPRKEKKKPFDPYSKSENAPSGMRRLQTERPGKSHTFKN
ncbi:ribonuclease H-like domain-containing protein [Calycina marina]|uniref:Ribonuclease H-like domain-containing protein n=1 Tax=Calycina marina TaxID=1763456 RepID=A0A9P7Z597_9HELO|nr:ribonuclease H-like domain-containing protein [Calycina marina]